MNKKLIKVQSHENKHWVGNGFHVHGIIRPTEDIYPYTNPFILMDYASPKHFPKTQSKLGVGAHPHKGFETVTFALQGEVEHRDSAGGGGVIKEGDVQWMTAGEGIIHDEFHSREFADRGGIFEMIQLWVNLPSKDKLTKPKYQNLKDSDFSIIEKNGYKLKLIAGHFENKEGIASTFSQMNIYQIEMNESSSINLNFKEGTNTIILVMDGAINIEDTNITKRHVALFGKDGSDININANTNSKVLVLNATPIEEPIYTHGPFVMNTKDEIQIAINEFRNGEMGQLD